MHFLSLNSNCCSTHVAVHHCDIIMGAMASQIAKLTIVYWTVYSGADQRKHQSSASLAFVRGIHRWPVNYPHTWPVTRKMFPFNDVIMSWSVQHRGIFHRAIWRWDTIKVRKIWMICQAENGAKYILYFCRPEESSHIWYNWPNQLPLVALFLLPFANSLRTICAGKAVPNAIISTPYHMYCWQ